MPRIFDRESLIRSRDGYHLVDRFGNDVGNLAVRVRSFHRIYGNGMILRSESSAANGITIKGTTRDLRESTRNFRILVISDQFPTNWKIRGTFPSSTVSHKQDVQVVCPYIYGHQCFQCQNRVFSVLVSPLVTPIFC